MSWLKQMVCAVRTELDTWAENEGRQLARPARGFGRFSLGQWSLNRGVSVQSSGLGRETGTPACFQVVLLNVNFVDMVQ